MGFKASKVRQPKGREPNGRGTPLIPSVPIRTWYSKTLQAMTTSMIDDYKRSINEVMSTGPVQRVFAQDASANSIFQRVLGLLDKKWSRLFEAFAKSTSEKFVQMSDDYAKTSTQFSLSNAGVKAPTFRYTEAVTNTLGAAVDFNHTLITGLQADAHEKIYSAVMLSLTSPNPEEQGQPGIEAALKGLDGFTKDRIKLISRDQTSKLYSALADEHMDQNGVDEFEWLHSSAGKVPRQSHVDKNGMVFKINDPRLWEGKKSDQGPPGWAINCRCRRVPVI